MIPAYYLIPIPGHHGALDRAGGLPTHEPPSFPNCPTCGEEMRFLAQLYSDSDWSWPGDCLCVQIYQCLDEGECDPFSKVVSVPRSAPLNVRAAGRRHPLVAPYDMCREPHQEPDDESLTLETIRELPYVSKLGGAIGPYSDLPDNAKFLARILEQPFEFNFSTYPLLIYLSESGEIACQ